METTTLSVSDGTHMTAHVARPEGAAKKGIIIIQEAFGVTDYIRRMTARFAKQGYLAIAPEFFHRSAKPGEEFSYSDFGAVGPHMEALTLEGQAADLQAAYEWLVSEGVPKEKIAALGFCMGGRAAFLANETLPLACAVSFYGGGIAAQLLDRVENLSGPQLLIWGGADSHIDANQREAVTAALRAAGKEFEEKTFEGAGHAFARDVGDHYDEAATKEAWMLADTFLSKHLV